MTTLVRDLVGEVALHMLCRGNSFNKERDGLKFLFVNRTCSNAIWRNFRSIARIEIDKEEGGSRSEMDNKGVPNRSLENSPYVRIFTDEMIDGEPPSRERQLIVSIEIFKTILRYNMIRRIKNFVITQNWRNEEEVIKLMNLLYEADIESIGQVECLLNATRDEFWASIAKILQKFSPLDFTCCSEKVLVFLNEEISFKKFIAGKWMSITRRHVPMPNNFDFINAEFFSLALANHVDPVVLKMLNQIQAETMELYSLDGHWSIIDVAKTMEININHPIKNFMWFVNTRQCAFLAETFEAILVTLPNLEYFTVVNAPQENIVFFRNEFIGSELVVLDNTLATFKTLLNDQNSHALFTFQALYRITVYDLEDCYIILDRLLQVLSRHAVVKKVAEYRDHFDPAAEPKTDLPDIKILDLDSLMSIPFTDSEKAGNLNEIKHEISGQINEQRWIKIEIIIAYTQKDTYDFT